MDDALFTHTLSARTNNGAISLPAVVGVAQGRNLPYRNSSARTNNIPDSYLLIVGARRITLEVTMTQMAQHQQWRDGAHQQWRATGIFGRSR